MNDYISQLEKLIASLNRDARQLRAVHYDPTPEANLSSTLTIAIASYTTDLAALPQGQKELVV